MQIREIMKTYKEEYSHNSKEILYFVQNWGKRKLVNSSQILVRVGWVPQQSAPSVGKFQIRLIAVLTSLVGGIIVT